MEPDELDSLDIVTKVLDLRIYTENDGYWNRLVTAFLKRMAVLGHFERLAISIDDYWLIEDGETYFFSSVIPVANALIDVCNGNSNLTYLDISDSYWPLNWGPRLKRIFKAMEEHKSLRTVVLPGYSVNKFSKDEDSEDEDSEHHFAKYFWLERLLSRNRSITVLNSSGKRHSDGNRIDKLYLLNHWFFGSPKLVTEPPLVRPLLVAAALVESPSENFQLTSLLMSNHTDILCEFINGFSLAGRSASQSAQGEGTLSSTIALPPESNRDDDSPKRKTRTQPSRAAKKAARHEA